MIILYSNCTYYKRNQLSHYTLAEARAIHGWSVKKLSKESDISVTAINRIEKGEKGCKHHAAVAEALAIALALEVHEIEWPNGLSLRGRPPHTGGKLTLTVTQTHTISFEINRVCSGCNQQLPLTGQCDNCA